MNITVSLFFYKYFTLRLHHNAIIGVQVWKKTIILVCVTMELGLYGTAL